MSEFTVYGYADTEVLSALSLPELSSTSPATKWIVLRIEFESLPEPEFNDWLHHWRNCEDVDELALARIDGGYLLRFPGLADLSLADSNTIKISPLPGVAEHTLRHLVLDQAIPRLLAQRGRLVLHAGVAALGDDRCVLIVGPSGQGKSTLTTALAASFGGSVLADDCVVITFDGDQPLAVPSYAGVRLWPDSAEALLGANVATQPVNEYSSKLRAALPAAASLRSSGAWPIVAILVLPTDAAEPGNPADSAELIELNAGSACMALMRNTFQLDVTDVRHVQGLLELAAQASRRLPVLELRHRRDYALLPKVTQAILERLQDL